MPATYSRLIRSSAAIAALVVAATLAVGPAANAQSAPTAKPSAVSAQTQAEQRQKITLVFNTINGARAAKGFKPLKMGVAATVVLQDYVDHPGQDPAGPDSLKFSKLIRGHDGYGYYPAGDFNVSWESSVYTVESAYSVVGMVPGAAGGNSMHVVGYKYASAPAETFDTAEDYFTYIDRAQVAGPTPAVSGDPVWGGTLTVDPGTWPAGTTFAYQWFYTNTYGYSWAVNNSDHPPVPSIFISDVDMRNKLSVRVTATLPGYRANVMWVAASDFIAVPGYVQAPAAVSATGFPEPGGTLTAVPGAWEAGTTLSYQWVRGNFPIEGATLPTYTFPLDSGQQTVSVRVTGSKIGKRDTSVTSPAVTVVDINLRPPSILVGNPWVDLRGGDAQVGEILTGYDMSWMDGTVITRQWKRDGVAVPGATTNKYTLTTADIGKAITFVVTGTHPGYMTRTLTSDPTTLIVARRPQVQNTTAPGVVGTGLLGTTFTSIPGTWTAGTKLSYQWFWVIGVTSAPIAGATGPSYAPTADLNGAYVRLQVTGTLDGYDPRRVETATSLRISKSVVAAPVIATKSWFAGDIITASVWNSGAKLTYQWKRSGIAITGATGASYRLTTADIGKTMTLTVTGALTGYPTASAASNASSKVGQRQVLMTALPTTSYGSRTLPKAGQTVRIISAGRWTPGAKISYQWKLNGVAIKGAVWSAYVLPVSAAGKLLTVTVTAKIPYWKDASTTTAPAVVLRR